MGRARRARRTPRPRRTAAGRAAAQGLGALGYALLKAEALHARWAIGTQFPESPRTRGGARRGRRPPAQPDRAGRPGDSSAAGWGPLARGDHRARLARGISAAARSRVHLTNVAVSGARSPDLDEQVERAPGPGARPEARRHQHRRQRRDPPDRQGHRHAASRRRGRRAARSRRRGDRRDLPGPRHRPAGGAAAAPGRPAPGARPAGRGADRGPLSQPAGAPSRSGTSSVREFASRPQEMFSSDRFHPPAWGMRGLPPCCCRARWRPSASRPAPPSTSTATRSPRAGARRAGRPGRRPGRRHRGRPGRLGTGWAAGPARQRMARCPVGPPRQPETDAAAGPTPTGGPGRRGACRLGILGRHTGTSHGDRPPNRR